MQQMARRNIIRSPGKSIVLGLILCSLIVPATVNAQFDTPRWGKITAEHLAMTSFPSDPEANAVILADYGEVTFDHDFAMVYTVHRRIKILSEAGYDYGTVNVRYLNKRHRVKNFQGQTFVPNGNGKPTRIKVDKKSIFTEEITGQLHQKKMTLPALAPGVVVEYKYSIVSDFRGQIPQWDFQDNEPVVWSEFVAELPDIFSFVTVLRGTLRYDIQETENTKPNGLASQRHRWVMVDVPAIREEPFMTTLSDYSVRLTLQMSGYYDPSVGTVQTLGSWPDLAKGLLTDTDFGRRLDPSKVIRDLVAELTEGLSGNEKIAAIHNYVRHNIEWDGTDGFYSTSSLNRILENKTGDSGEINLLLVSMLRAGGFDAHPMLISTRSNGSPVETYPILDQFDYVLAYVKRTNSGFALDGTSKHHPFNVLPAFALNSRGFVVSDDFGWRDIGARPLSKTYLHIRGELADDSSIDGTVQFAASGYAAVDAREYSDSGSIGDYIKENLFDNAEDIEIEMSEVEADSLDVFLTTSQVSATDRVVDGGDYLYVNPLVALTVGENPFKSESRSFPVDYNYPIDNTYTLELRIPEEYSVVELPVRRSFNNGSNKAAYTRVVEDHGDVVRIVCRFRINETEFSPREYDGLRTFYDEVIASEQDQIVLGVAKSE